MALASVVTACGNAASKSPASSNSATITTIDQGPLTSLPEGSWYGEDVRLSVDSSGATFQFNCASGSIPGTLSLADDGSFQLDGSYSLSVQSPTNQTVSAVYSGAVTDSGLNITLTVTNSDSGAVMGSYQLVFGTTSPLESCL